MRSIDLSRVLRALAALKQHLDLRAALHDSRLQRGVSSMHEPRATSRMQTFYVPLLLHERDQIVNRGKRVDPTLQSISVWVPRHRAVERSLCRGRAETALLNSGNQLACDKEPLSRDRLVEQHSLHRGNSPGTIWFKRFETRLPKRQRGLGES